MARWISITEPHDLSPWQEPLRAPPAGLGPALAAGVRVMTQAPALAGTGHDGLADGAWRHADGTLSVACTTAMPGVRAAMWDWWFGWHGLSSARYRLWHPDAHKGAWLAEDRRHLPPGRPRYVGNVSAVDETIGPTHTRLAIGFVPPADFGLDPARVDAGGTAVCATVSLRPIGLRIGRLVHLVVDGADGCTMHSRFHLGEFASPVPGLARLLNRPALRHRLASDDLGLALLRHCAEEMHHLAGQLPGLHARFKAD
jgi:hypothetical protein